MEKPAWLDQCFNRYPTIHIGDCKDGGAIGDCAHYHPDSDTICIQRKYWSDDYPTFVFLHEYAHSVFPEEGHTKNWKDCFQKLLEHFGYAFDVNFDTGVERLDPVGLRKLRRGKYMTEYVTAITPVFMALAA